MNGYEAICYLKDESTLRTVAMANTALTDNNELHYSARTTAPALFCSQPYVTKLKLNFNLEECYGR